MTQMNVFEGVPGIDSLAKFRPETAKHLYDLALALMDGESPLTRPKRKFIAAYVSYFNSYMFYKRSSMQDIGDNQTNVVGKVMKDMAQANISDKMKALMRIACKVQVSGREVKEEDITEARKYGADDRTIHDIVLIAAAFNMFNRYADALTSLMPADSAE